MKKSLLALFCIAYITTTVQAQFILKGKIEFEKTVNLHKRMEMGDEGWGAEMKKNTPEYRHTYFNLLFTDGKTIYQPGRESNEKANPWWDGPASENIIYTDVASGNFTASKQVFDQAFLVQDSLHKYKWKITNETRKIAGFECRKATTVIMDSVFVVAFYTDEIVTSGGPESFNGLPGMILGVVMPRLFTNWYATKIELEEVKESALTPPKKGKKTDIPGLQLQVQKSLKDWGNWGTKYMWQILI